MRDNSCIRPEEGRDSYSKRKEHVQEEEESDVDEDDDTRRSLHKMNTHVAEPVLDWVMCKALDKAYNRRTAIAGWNTAGDDGADWDADTQDIPYCCALNGCKMYPADSVDTPFAAVVVDAAWNGGVDPPQRANRHPNEAVPV